MDLPNWSSSFSLVYEGQSCSCCFLFNSTFATAVATLALHSSDFHVRLTTTISSHKHNKCTHRQRHTHTHTHRQRLTQGHTHTHADRGTHTQTRTPWGNFDFVVMACQRALHIQLHALHTHTHIHTRSGYTHAPHYTLRIRSVARNELLHC